ncbi:MAG: PilZ domain-containing protein [Nitrospirota bacterium]|nr:MAG: PilZ domain-containing protein [Nitrospirota bacterium]
MKKIIVEKRLKHFLDKNSSFILRSDIEMVSASSCEEMLEIHVGSPAELVIASLSLPRMGGDRLCKTLRSDKELRNVSVLLTCDNEQGSIDKCVFAGANAIITEPVYSQELYRKASELLDVPQRRGIRVLMNIAVDGKFKNSFYCSSKNISSSGMLIETNKALNKGDTLNFSIFMRLNRVTIEGEVVRKLELGDNHFQYGLRFNNLDATSKALIDDYIKIREMI